MPKKQVLLQLCLTKFLQKVYISNVIILKNEKIFSKIIFLRKVKKYS